MSRHRAAASLLPCLFVVLSLPEFQVLGWCILAPKAKSTAAALVARPPPVARRSQVRGAARGAAFGGGAGRGLEEGLELSGSLFGTSPFYQWHLGEPV